MSWVIEDKKPKPFYLINFSLGEFVLLLFSLLFTIEKGFSKSFLHVTIQIDYLHLILVVLFIDWNFSSPCYLNSAQPVFHHPCSYRKKSKFIFCLCLSVTVSCLVCCVHCYIEHVVFEYLTVFFRFSTSSEYLNYYFVITSQVPVCYPVDILFKPGYYLTVFRFYEVNLSSASVAPI